MTAHPKPVSRVVNRNALPLDEAPVLDVCCPLCHKRPAALTRHHVLPKSLGGSDIPENLVWACGHGTVGCHGVLETRGRCAGTVLDYPQVADRLVEYVSSQPAMVEYLASVKYRGWLFDYYTPARLPYVCEAHGPQPFRTCNWCPSECVRVTDSVLAREDRERAEGRA